MVETSDEWIRTRTGIEERRIAAEDEKTSDMAVAAARRAMEDANIEPEDLDMILVATVTPDQAFPTVSCMIQEKLGAFNACAMDISAACAGFMYGLVTGKQFIEAGTYKHVLVIGVEKLSGITDWDDRNTAVLFGDGAGAAVVGPVSDDKGILSFELGADGRGGKHLYLDEKDHTIMNGREVFKFAVRQMGESSVNVIEKRDYPKRMSTFGAAPSQHPDHGSGARTFGASGRKMSKTVHKYGNTSAASIPISLVEELEAGKIKDGDVIVMVGFGGGLTWGAIAMRWGR